MTKEIALRREDSPARPGHRGIAALLLAMAISGCGAPPAPTAGIAPVPEPPATTPAPEEAVPEEHTRSLGQRNFEAPSPWSLSPGGRTRQR